MYNRKELFTVGPFDNPTNLESALRKAYQAPLPDGAPRSGAMSRWYDSTITVIMEYVKDNWNKDPGQAYDVIYPLGTAMGILEGIHITVHPQQSITVSFAGRNSTHNTDLFVRNADLPTEMRRWAGDQLDILINHSTVGGRFEIDLLTACAGIGMDIESDIVQEFLANLATDPHRHISLETSTGLSLEIQLANTFPNGILEEEGGLDRINYVFEGTHVGWNVGDRMAFLYPTSGLPSNRWIPTIQKRKKKVNSFIGFLATRGLQGSGIIRGAWT